MSEVIIKRQRYEIAGKPVIVTTGFALLEKDDFSLEEQANLVSFAEQADAIAHISVENVLTGENDTVALSDIEQSFPRSRWQSLYLKTSSWIQSDGESEAGLSFAEVEAERQRYRSIR